MEKPISSAKLIAFGNSQMHFIFSHSPEVEQHLHISQTMYRIGRLGMPFAEICESISKECKIIFIFGSVDVRCHLVKHFRKDGQNAVDTLAHRYLEQIQKIRRITSPKSLFYVLGITAPIDPMEINPDLPPLGSISERIAVRRLLNESLRQSSELYGIEYIPMPHSYENSKGSLKMMRSDGHSHIAMDSVGDVVRSISKTTKESISFPKPSLKSRISRSCLRSKALACRDARAMMILGQIIDDRAPTF